MTFEAIGQKVRLPKQSAQNEVGTPPGAIDVNKSPEHTTEIGNWLTQRSPAQVDHAAVLSARSRGVELRVKLEGRYPRGENGEVLPSYQVAVGCIVSGDPVAREALIADFEKLMQPPPTETIENWIAELTVITAGRSRDGIEAELLLTAYASRLLRYPTDVVRYALLERSWQWFPTWHELQKVCDAAVGPRAHIIAALKRPVEKPEPEHPKPTAEERQRISDLIAEKFPNVPQPWRDLALQKIAPEEDAA